MIFEDLVLEVIKSQGEVILKNPTDEFSSRGSVKLNGKLLHPLSIHIKPSLISSSIPEKVIHFSGCISIVLFVETIGSVWELRPLISSLVE